MTTGHVFIATSLDGYVAREDHQIDWLIKYDSNGEDHGYDAFIADKDCLVMGRGSYETVRGFSEWPYNIPVIVMSKSLSQNDIPIELKDKIEISTSSPAELMQALENRGWKKAYIDGGKLVQSFIREGFVTDLCITTIPILIGNGISLFGHINADIDLELKNSQSFQTGMVQSLYAIKNRL